MIFYYLSPNAFPVGHAMSLIEFQKVLLSLYTDEPFLISFTSNREKALADFVLTNREKEALGKLAEEKIKTFSKELRHKRVRVARNIFKKTGPEKTPVLLFSTHHHGPALFFLYQGAEMEIPLSKGSLSLFSEIAKKYTTLSYSAIVSAASSLLVAARNDISMDEPTFSDLIRAMGIIRRYRLQGKLIHKTL